MVTSVTRAATYEKESKTLRLSMFIVAAIVCAVPSVSAQTAGRVSVGASITFNITTDADVASATTFGPLVRLNPHKGLGQEIEGRWKADAAILSVGAVYSLF